MEQLGPGPTSSAIPELFMFLQFVSRSLACMERNMSLTVSVDGFWTAVKRDRADLKFVYLLHGKRTHLFYSVELYGRHVVLRVHLIKRGKLSQTHRSTTAHRCLITDDIFFELSCERHCSRRLSSETKDALCGACLSLSGKTGIITVVTMFFNKGHFISIDLHIII